MGGNLLKDITRRHSAEEYINKANDVVRRLRYGVGTSSREVSRIKLIPAYNHKESFGDADIVYATYNNQPLSTEELKEFFKTTRVVRNGEVTSFDYEELQVDLIHAEQDYFEYALAYFSYNDLGNFVGKLARYFGLSHGHKGLYLPLREPNGELIDSILISTDHDATLRFVGLDPIVFNHYGFDTMEDVYRYVQSSPYFNPDSYKLENISAIGRVRDRKRESYRNFLKFNESYSGPVLEKVKDKSVFLERIFRNFFWSEERFNAAMQKYAFDKAVRIKFNGDIVRNLTYLQDRELGEFMKHLRELPQFKPAVLMYLPEDQINNNIMKEYNEHTACSRGN